MLPQNFKKGYNLAILVKGEKMTNFSFCNPVRIEFGKDKEKHIGQYMKESGAKKALVLYGSECVRKSGLMDVVESSLKANGI